MIKTWAKTGLETVIIILILFFGLLAFNNHVSGSKVTNPIPAYSFVSEKNAVINQVDCLQPVKEINGNISLLSLTKKTLTDNKETAQKISRLLTVSMNFSIPFKYPRQRLYPSDKDDPPHLS